MACARIKSYVTDLNNDMVSSLCKLIRYPNGEIVYFVMLIARASSPNVDSPEGRLIQKELIPAVAVLRKRYPMSLDVLFPDSLVQLGHAQQPLFAHDVVATDRFFDSFLYE